MKSWSWAVKQNFERRLSKDSCSQVCLNLV